MGANKSKSTSSTNPNADVIEITKQEKEENCRTTYEYAIKKSRHAQELQDKKINYWMEWFEVAIKTRALQGFKKYKLNLLHNDLYQCSTKFNVSEWRSFEQKLQEKYDMNITKFDETFRLYNWEKSNSDLGKELLQIADAYNETRYNEINKSIDEVIYKHGSLELIIDNLNSNYSTRDEVIERFERDGFFVHYLGKGQIRLSWDVKILENCDSNVQLKLKKRREHLSNLDKIEMIQNSMADLFEIMEAAAKNKELFESHDFASEENWICVVSLKQYTKELNNKQSLCRFFVKDIFQEFVTQYPMIHSFTTKFINEKMIVLSWEEAKDDVKA